MDRCVPQVIREGKTPEQAAGQCAGMWESHMKKKQQSLRLPIQHLRAAVEPSSFDADARTVEMRWYSGGAVLRNSFFDGPYMLQFSMDPKDVRLERFQSGRAVLKAGHSMSDDVDAVLGVIEEASIGKDGGRARIRFSQRESVTPVLQDIRDGILRNVSMEAIPYRLEEITEKGDDIPTLLATDWEPLAVALVSTGADAQAQLLSGEEDFPCTVNLSAEAVADAQMEGKTMRVRLLSTNEIVEIKDDEYDEELHSQDLTVPEADPPPTPKEPYDRIEDRKLQFIKEADNKRAARIRELMLHFELDEFWAKRHINLNSTIEAAVADARKIVAERAPDIDGRLSFGNDYDSIGWRVDRMSEALAFRAMTARGASAECPEPAKRYERYSIAECAFDVLDALGTTRGRALDPLRAPFDVIKLAMGTTDFPGLLANVLNKTLMPMYMQAMPTYRQIAQQRQFRDYRPHRFVRKGDFPLTQLVGEGGEVTEGAMGEGSETVTALKYGRILNILWEVLVNDDVGAFQDFGGMVASRIVDRENALFYQTCITAASGLGPNLADGVAVHNSAHNNVNSAGALSNDRLNEAFGLMAEQTSIDGLKLNVPPAFVLTSATSHVLARTLLTQIYPTQASEVNPFSGILQAIYDANLSDERYYVIAAPSALPNYIYGTVDGQGPRFEVRQGFEIEGVQVKAVHDFGCGAIDYRGSVTGAGS